MKGVNAKKDMLRNGVTGGGLRKRFEDFGQNWGEARRTGRRGNVTAGFKRKNWQSKRKRGDMEAVTFQKHKKVQRRSGENGQRDIDHFP